MHRPCEQREHRGEDEGSGPLEPHTPRPGQEQRDESEREEHRVSRPDEREQGDSEADRAKRPIVGANAARTTRSPQTANAAANTGSLDSSWNMSA